MRMYRSKSTVWGKIKLMVACIKGVFFYEFPHSGANLNYSFPVDFIVGI